MLPLSRRYAMDESWWRVSSCDVPEGDATHIFVGPIERGVSVMAPRNGSLDAFADGGGLPVVVGSDVEYDFRRGRQRSGQGPVRREAGGRAGWLGLRLCRDPGALALRKEKFPVNDERRKSLHAG